MGHRAIVAGCAFALAVTACGGSGKSTGETATANVFTPKLATIRKGESRDYDKPELADGFQLVCLAHGQRVTATIQPRGPLPKNGPVVEMSPTGARITATRHRDGTLTLHCL